MRAPTKIPGSLFKKPNTKHYYMRYKDPAGIWRNQSTGEADLEAAKRVLQQQQRDYLTATAGGPQQAHAHMLSARPDFLDVPAPTVAELMEWWLRQPSRRSGGMPRESTISSVDAHIICAPFGRYKAAQITGRNINEWLQALHAPEAEGGCGLMASTTNWLRGLLSAAYTAAIKDGWPAYGWFYTNPVYQSRPVSEPLSDENAHLDDYPVLRAEEIGPVLMAIDPEHRALYATAIYTGLRQGELFALRASDIDFERRRILVRRSHKQHVTKSRVTRAVPINSDLEPWLRAALEGREGDVLVFPAFDRYGRESMRTGGSRWCAILRTALLDSYVADPDTSDGLRKLGITFHALRHTTASLLIEAGATLSEVQQYLGHSNPALTARIYVHLSKDHLARVGQLLEGKFGGANAATPEMPPLPPQS